MLKTIKTTRYMRLDELIKYCVENDITDKKFYASTGVKMGIRLNGVPTKIYKKVEVTKHGGFIIRDNVKADDLFPVEVEEPITKETKFDTIFAITVEEDRDISYADTFRQTTIPKALRPHTSYLIAMVNDRPELIWERKEE